MFRKQPRSVTITLRIVNVQSKPIHFILEPWAEEMVLASKQEIDVILTGPSGNPPEIEFGEDVIVVFGWAGSTGYVKSNGQEILRGHAAVPSAGSMSIRQFVNTVIRGSER